MAPCAVMRVLLVCVIITFSVVFAKNESFTEAIDQKVRDCVNNTPEDGNMTIAYVTIDPYFYKAMEPFNVKNFTYNKDKLGQNITYFTETVLRASCLCENLPLNGHNYIVNPMIIDGIPADALILCVFHDDMNDVYDVLDIPRRTLHNWMLAQLITRLPRSLIDPPENFTSDDCVDHNGHPTSRIIGQKTCFYMNWAKFEKNGDNVYVEQKVYFGSFLGSQFPNFTTLSSGITKNAYDIVAVFDFVHCALLKRNSRLSPHMKKTGCNQRFFSNGDVHLGIMSCCCIGQNDPNCNEVKSAIKEKKIVCLDGILRKNVSLYFDKECPFMVTKKYHRTSLTDFDSVTDFEHLQAVIPQGSQISFKKAGKCILTATTCEGLQVDVIEKGCCTTGDFCSAYNGLKNDNQRCYWSFGENQVEYECYLVFYRANNQWYLSSQIWFDLKQSKLVHLYTAHYGVTKYDMYLGFLAEKAMTKSCNDKKKREKTTYYVIHCVLRICDWNFQNGFFDDLDEKLISDAVEKSHVPQCENGSWIVTTDAVNNDLPVPKPVTTRMFGQYCILQVAIEYIDSNKTISMEFGPVFPKPKECNTHHKEVNGRFNLTCCYEASHNKSYVDPKCHYSTILSVVEALQQTEEGNGEDPVQDDAVEPSALIRQRVRENADHCEQSGAVGYHGKPSRRCTPGGKGCFHVNGLEDPKEAVIASCTGRGEELMATSKDAFDRYHEALICLTEEAKGQCHAVYDGTRWRKLCCCKISTEKKHVGRCAEDSNLLFHENEYVAKRVKEFKDDDGDKDKK